MVCGFWRCQLSGSARAARPTPSRDARRAPRCQLASEVGRGRRVIEGIVITVTGGVLVAVILGLWMGRGLLLQWYHEQRQVDRAMKQEDASQELVVLRKQVLEVARARDVVIPVSAKGVNPTAVEFSNESRQFYFNDHARYVQAMRSGRVPPTHSFSSKPPVPISRWTRDALKQWLADHPD